jgi:hypothetical protein
MKRLLNAASIAASNIDITAPPHVTDDYLDGYAQLWIFGAIHIVGPTQDILDALLAAITAIETHQETTP